MKTYMIGYDLNRPGQKYDELFDAIKKHSGWWWHYLDSTWIVKSNMTAAQIRDILKQHIDNNDELLVVRLAGEWASTGFSKEANDWIYKNMSYE